METVDVLIAAFAVIAVVGSIGGAALYEPPAGGQDFEVTFSESQEETLAQQQEAAGLAAATGPDDAALITRHNITAGGVTALSFEVRLSTDRQGAGTVPRTATPEYTAYLVAPDGTETTPVAGSFTAASTTITLLVPTEYTIEVPAATTVQAGSIAEAREQVNATHLQSNATGVWEVHVHLTYPQGSAPVAERVTAESTPTLKRVIATVGTDLDISPVA